MCSGWVLSGFHLHFPDDSCSPVHPVSFFLTIGRFSFNLWFQVLILQRLRWISLCLSCLGLIELHGSASYFFKQKNFIVVISSDTLLSSFSCLLHPQTPITRTLNV